MQASNAPRPDYFGSQIPFMALLGLKAREIGEGVAVVELPFRPDLANSGGVFHGGVLMSVLDFAMSAAARGPDASVIASTIDMHTNFLKGVQADLVITGRCIRKGRTVAFSEGRITTSDGDLVATGSATFVVRERRRPSG